MENKMSFNKSVNFKDIKIALYMGEFGCSKCLENFSGLYQGHDEYVCTESTYIKNKSFISVNPVFDINCLQYSNDKEIIKCNKCNSTTILGTDGKCYDATSLKNCISAISENKCQKCSSAYVVVGDSCVEKEIKNCKYYSPPPSNEQICLKCMERHYLLDNKCEKGKIKNCKVYENSGSMCNTCEDGYHKIKVKDDVNYCIPITTHENCESFNSYNFQNNILTCDKCQANYLLENLSLNSSVCNSYSLVAHCKSYDHGNNFRDSTFICNECINGYYLKNNECILRNIEIKFCLVYEISGQLCKTCEREYYPKTDQTECLINPGGINGCSLFSNEKTCIKCKNGYYLEENECKIVLLDNLVEGCVVYLDKSTCDKCESPKILDPNTKKCETPAEIPNCEVYKDLNNCLKCGEGFGILLAAGNQKCEAITQVENCLSYKTESPFPCDVCKKNFFLNQSLCVEVKPLIENCAQNKTNDLCKKCIVDHILSTDKKKCTLFNIPGNCQTFQEESEPFCVLCKPGYLLDNERKCIIDSRFKKDLSCLFFDSNNTEICEICQIGWYQNNEGKCIKNLSNNTGENNTKGENEENTNTNKGDVKNTNDKPNPQVSSVGFVDMWKYLNLLLFVLFIMRFE